MSNSDYVVISRIGKKLKKRREYRRFHKTDLAKQTGLGRNFISDVEDGKATAQIGKVASYAKGLDLELALIDKNNPLEALQRAIEIALKTDPSLANRLISALNDEEKAAISLHEVQIRRPKRIKKIVLTV